jgi:hypothetical protein
VLPPDQRGVERPLIPGLPVGFELSFWCDVGAHTVEEIDLTISVPRRTVVAGDTAEIEVTVTNDGPFDAQQLVLTGGDSGSTCTPPPGYPTLAVGQSLTATCSYATELGDAGEWFERTDIIRAASAWSPPTTDHQPRTTPYFWTTDVRVICTTHRRPDIGPWLDAAMTWLDCDARFLAPPPAAGFRPLRSISRLGLAQLLLEATFDDFPPNPNPPVADVPPAQRGVVALATADPDGDGPRVAPMTGFPGGSFQPARAVTREELVNAIWRWVGRPEGPDHPFGDVPAWIDEAVGWAFDTEVVTGFPGPAFRPRQGATRGEVLRMLFRADAWFDGV